MATAPARVFYPHIVKERDYCGGKAAIDNTRVRVNNVVFLHKQGHSPAQIREAYPDLSLAQVYAALGYYYDHQSEIEAELAEDEGWAEEHERRKTQYLATRAKP
jgi:uncharacterized protein (DUF433 family)